MAEKTIIVRAAPLADPALAGKARVAKEGTVDRWIDEQTPVEVPLTAYYLRKLQAGELVTEARVSSAQDEEPSA